MRRYIESCAILGKIKVRNLVERVIDKLTEDSGNFLEEAVKYIIALVIGALVLGGLYALFKVVILPAIQGKTQDLFNYSA